MQRCMVGLFFYLPSNLTVSDPLILVKCVAIPIFPNLIMTSVFGSPYVFSAATDTIPSDGFTARRNPVELDVLLP